MSRCIVDRHRCQWQDWEIALIVVCRRWGFVQFASFYLDRTQAACNARSSKIYTEGYSHLRGVVSEVKAFSAFMNSHPELEYCTDLLRAYTAAKKLENMLKLIEVSGYKITMIKE